MPAATRLYITHINAEVAGDTQFPEYDLNEWNKVSSDVRLADENNKYDVDFCVYER